MSMFFVVYLFVVLLFVFSPLSRCAVSSLRGCPYFRASCTDMQCPRVLVVSTSSPSLYVKFPWYKLQSWVIDCLTSMLGYVSVDGFRIL